MGYLLSAEAARRARVPRIARRGLVAPHLAHDAWRGRQDARPHRVFGNLDSSAARRRSRSVAAPGRGAAVDPPLSATLPVEHPGTIADMDRPRSGDRSAGIDDA